MDLFRSKKRDVEQASLEDGPGLKRKHHGLSNSLDNLLDIAKENDECLGMTSDNTASESDDDTDTNKASKKQKAFAKISIKREKKKEKELRKKTEKQMISMDDFLGKQTEFKMWLYEEKCKNAGDISSPKLKVFFKQFVRLWNKKKLAPKYYRCSTLPASPGPLTTRKCNFLTESGNAVPLPTECESNAICEVNPPTSPFVTFGKTPPKVFRSKKFQLFGSSKDVALLSVAPIGSPQVVNITKENLAQHKDQYQVPKVGKTIDKLDEKQTELSGGAIPYKVSVFPWATNEEDLSSSNDKFEVCSTATPPRLKHSAVAGEESWPPPPSEKEIFGGNNMASQKDSPHVPPPPPPRIGSLKKSNPAQSTAKSPKLATNYADPYDTLPDAPSAKRDILSHYQDPVDCVSAESRSSSDNPRLVIQTSSQNDEPDLSLYCKPVSEKRLSKEELEEMYAKPLKRAKKNDIGSIDGMKVRPVPEGEENNSDLLNEIMDHINKTKPEEVDDKVKLTKQPDPDYATIDECMGKVSEHKPASEAKCENINRTKRDMISIGNIPLLQPKISSPKFASISRSKKMRVMAASTEKIYETYLSHGRKGNPFKGKLDEGKLGKGSFGNFTQSLKLKSRSQPDISFNEGLQAVDIDCELDKNVDHKMSSPSLSTFKPVEKLSRFHETNLKNSDRAKSYEDDLKCVSEPKTPTIIATPSFDSLCDVTPLSCKYTSSQSLPTKSGSFESLSDHSHLSMSTSSSLSFGPDGKSGSLQSLQSDKSLSPVKEEEETTQLSERPVKYVTEKCKTVNDNVQSMDKEHVKGTDVFSKNSLALTPGKISALKHGIDLSVYLLKPQKDEGKPVSEETVKTGDVKSSGTDRVSAKKPLDFQNNPKLFETQSRLVIKDTLSGVRTKLEQGKLPPKKETGRRHTVQSVHDVNQDEQKKANVPNIGIASKTRKVVSGKSKPVSFESTNRQIVGNKHSEIKKRMLSVDDHYLETDLDSVTSDRPRRQMKKSKSHSGFERDSSTVTTDIW